MEKPAKTCYSHIGGKLGELLLDVFVDKKWMAKKHQSDKHYYITEEGKKGFKRMGVDISGIKDEEM